MADAPQGPGWFQASDGKWYPPQPMSQTPPGQPLVPPGPPPGWAQGPDGQWHPAGQPIQQQKSNTGCIVGIVAAVVLLLVIPVMAILAITFLGRTASAKFESVGTAIYTPSTTSPRRSSSTTAPASSSGGQSELLEQMHDELIASGMDAPTARCIIDKLDEAGFDPSGTQDLTTAEEELLLETTRDCVMSTGD